MTQQKEGAPSVPPTPEEIAHHEAGHFVVRHVLLPEYWYESITVGLERKKAPGSEIVTIGGGCTEPVGLSIPSWDAGPIIEPYAISLYAGLAAQVRYNPGCAEAAVRGARRDQEDAAEAFRLHGREPDRSNLTRQAEALVELHWPSISALAKALLLVEPDSDGIRSLDGASARAIVDRAATTVASEGVA